MSTKTFLTFNAGSSTIKIGIYQLIERQLVKIGFARVDLHASPILMEIHKEQQTTQVLFKHSLTEDFHNLIDEILRFLETHLLFDSLTAVGHRVVHGGDLFTAPTLLGRPEIDRLEKLIPLAPLHQPQALFIASAIVRLRPNLIQTASFDTAFHKTQSNMIRHYAIPEMLFKEGIKRFGFHGLSYQNIVSRLKAAFPLLSGKKVIVAHLGSGASLCAINHDESQDCSMGFSTLGGIPMATRSGEIDPGILLYLQKEKGYTQPQIEHLLYKESGLLGISGLSGDTRELLLSELDSAQLAIQIFTQRIAGEIGRMSATLNGFNALIFTGGIGEHQHEIRSEVCKRLSWLGLSLDQNRNKQNNGREEYIGLSTSPIKTLVIPADEEFVIASEILEVLDTKEHLS